MFVVEKCNALDDDSQPYTSYSYVTSENVISIELAHAAIFASEVDARIGHRNCDWAIRQGYFKVVTLAVAMRHMVSYNMEASEYHNGE